MAIVELDCVCARMFVYCDVTEVRIQGTDNIVSHFDPDVEGDAIEPSIVPSCESLRMVVGSVGCWTVVFVAEPDVGEGFYSRAEAGRILERASHSVMTRHGRSRTRQMDWINCEEYYIRRFAKISFLKKGFAKIPAIFKGAGLEDLGLEEVGVLPFYHKFRGILVRGVFAGQCGVYWLMDDSK